MHHARRYSYMRVLPRGTHACTLRATHSATYAMRRRNHPHRIAVARQHTSAEGRPIHVLNVTDHAAPGPKVRSGLPRKSRE